MRRAGDLRALRGGLAWQAAGAPGAPSARASACLDTALHQPGRVAEPVLDYWFGARGGARLVFTCLDRGQLGAAWAKRAQAGYRSPVAVAYETG